MFINSLFTCKLNPFVSIWITIIIYVNRFRKSSIPIVVPFLITPGSIKDTFTVAGDKVELAVFCFILSLIISMPITIFVNEHLVNVPDKLLIAFLIGVTCEIVCLGFIISNLYVNDLCKLSNNLIIDSDVDVYFTIYMNFIKLNQKQTDTNLLFNTLYAMLVCMYKNDSNTIIDKINIKSINVDNGIKYRIDINGIIATNNSKQPITMSQIVESNVKLKKPVRLELK